MSRMVGRLVVVGVLSLAGVSVPAVLAASATAAGDTCRGLPATIVGAPGEVLEGTTGDDVIVTNGAVRVFALRGNDVICTTNTAANSNHTPSGVNAGPGIDLVDRSGDLGVTVAGYIFLDGDDEFLGGTGPDEVWDRHPRAGRIVTGDGDDKIFLTRAADPRLELEAGEGRDSLMVDTQVRGLWTIDLTTGGPPRSARTVTGSGLEYVSDGGRTREEIVRAKTQFRVIGSAAGESVVLWAPMVRSVDLGGGDDQVRLSVPSNLHPSGHRPLVAGGAGTDLVWVEQERDRVLIDLADDRLDLRFGNPGPPQYRIPGFENVWVNGGSSRISGDDGPNLLTTNACPEVTRGRGGDDIIAFSDSAKFKKTCEADGQHFEMRGGDGDDQLIGSWLGDDLLIGGDGVDSANGQDGYDTCEAETTTECEATPVPARPRR